MADRYIAFDVETPNYANDRMSAIGITVVEYGEIVQEISTLINPQADFNYFNIKLTGITPDMVADKPSFPELWSEIEHIMDSGLLIAHNAPFDMSVLAKCLRHYGIDWRPLTAYACTCAMGRACYPRLENHKLSTLCDYREIALNHHDAGSDSHACAMLLLDYIDQGINVQRYLRDYDLQNICTVRKRNRTHWTIP